MKKDTLPRFADPLSREGWSSIGPTLSPLTLSTQREHCLRILFNHNRPHLTRAEIAELAGERIHLFILKAHSHRDIFKELRVQDLPIVRFHQSERLVIKPIRRYKHQGCRRQKRGRLHPFQHFPHRIPISPHQPPGSQFGAAKIASPLPRHSQAHCLAGQPTLVCVEGSVI